MCECTLEKKQWIGIWSGITGLFWMFWLSLKLSPIGFTCPANLDGATNFDREKYLGRWYEFARSESVPREWERFECQTATYQKGDDNFIKVYNVEYSIVSDLWPSAYDGWEKDKNARAQCSYWRNGLCQVKFFELAPWGNYKVLSVDHNSYAIVYGCTLNLAGSLNLDYLWILGRQPLKIGSTESNALKTKVWDIIKQQIPHFNLETVHLSIQVDYNGMPCKYSPLPPGMTNPNPNDLT